MSIEYNQQNIIDNFVDNTNNTNYFFSQEKKPFKSYNNNISNSYSLETKNTFENSEKSGKEYIYQKEEDIDYLKKFDLEKENDPFKYNYSKSKDIYSNEISNTIFKNYASAKFTNKTKSGKIPRPKKTSGIIPFDKKSYKNKYLINQKKPFAEQFPSKKIKSKYNSASENKYHSLQNLSGEEKRNIFNFSDTNKPKNNYGTIDSKSIKRSFSYSNYSNNIKNEEKKIFNSFNFNDNSSQNIYSNLNFYQNPMEDMDYLNQTEYINNKKFNQIDNNKSRKSNLKYTIKRNIIQNNIKSTRIDQKKNKRKSSIFNNYYNLADQNNAKKSYSTKRANSFNSINYNPKISLTEQNILNLNKNKTKFNNVINNYETDNDLVQIINKIKPIKYDVNNNYETLIEENNTQYLNNVQTFNNQNYQENNEQIVNTNDYLSQQELNQILNQTTINQNNNTYISLSPETNITPKENQILEYNIEPELLNPEYNNQNSENNYNIYNQSEQEKIIIDSDKNIVIDGRKSIYNDFDRSGFIKNYNGLSLPGKGISGNTKTNQDTFIIKTNINTIKDFNIFGVLDGHGTDGHYVSEFASNYIPSQIINNPEIKKLSSPEKIYKKLKDNNCKIIIEAFASADNQLKNMEFDSLESGCTCCLVIHVGTHILCANTGDSRAIVVYDQSNNINDIKSNNLDYLGTTPLSIDYKPDLPEEKERIILAGGDVERLKDEDGEGIGPYRVWAKGKDYPGLAISRSIGDLKAKKYGVISEPGIMEYDLNISTKYIIVCSDGVWEFLNNETVMNIGKQFYLENNTAKFCKELVSRSFKEWQKNELIVDDITTVIAFF